MASAVMLGAALLVSPGSCLGSVCRLGHPATTHVDILAMAQAVELYRADHGELPGTLLDLIDDGEGRRYLAGYDDAPQDAFGRPYLYEVRPDGTYSIWTLGDDGKPGGRDEDADADLASALEAREERAQATDER